MALGISSHNNQGLSGFPGDGSIQAHALYSHIGSMKITIKDKPFTESLKYRRQVLQAAFQSLLLHMKEMKRLNDLKSKLEDNLNRTKLQRYFHIWRKKINNKPKVVDKNENECNSSDEQKIKSFVQSIVRDQKKTWVVRKNNLKHQELMTKSKSRIHAIDPTIQKQLQAQKRIINRQNMKLFEQNQIIEKLKLRELENELQRGENMTLITAKRALNRCGKKTQHTLLHLMKDSSTSIDSLKPPKRPEFLLRMEERAEQRRERTRLAREERLKKLQWEKEQEENRRREQEERDRRQRLEEQMRLRCIHREQERTRAEKVQKNHIANELAKSFYRRYLLRNYIIKPLTRMVEEKYHYLDIADDHYKRSVMKKSITTWQSYAQNTIDRRLKLCISVYNKKILNASFTKWMNYTNERIEIYEEICKYYTKHLQTKCFTFWHDRVHDIKFKYLEDEQWAMNYYRDKLSAKFFKYWRKYVEISDEIKESERRKDKWRSLVQQVIPDFCPGYRGVLLD
uniref:Sfi1 spindle body domain-containing protein n=1 Tax=Bracon brevicornis TaxID=1563983 RepID=A0A6V7KMR1_9HYME